MISVMIISTGGSPDSDSRHGSLLFLTHSACRWGHPDTESGVVIEADVLSHGVHCFSTLYYQ
jgi:hypothetical protein